jgi:hypothetical protein
MPKLTDNTEQTFTTGALFCQGSSKLPHRVRPESTFCIFIKAAKQTEKA